MAHSEETKRKISISMKGRHSSPSTEFKKGQRYSQKTEFKKGQIPYTKLHPEVCQRGENHSNWKGGKPNCINCGKKLSSYLSKRCLKCSGKAKIGKNHPNWKGDNVCYVGLHRWIVKELGRPSKCEYCKTEGKRVYHWCNISRKYKRELNDWIRLCVPCHSKYDRNLIQLGGT